MMMPPPAVVHGRAEVGDRDSASGSRPGVAITECPISTAKGKGADVAWMTSEAYEKVKGEPCLPTVPPIWVEVLSPSNSRREMKQKKALYFEKGAAEVWFCDRKGKMTFFLTAEDAGSAASRFCPAFPAHVDV